MIIPKTQAKTWWQIFNFDSSVFKRGFFMDSPSTKQKFKVGPFQTVGHLCTPSTHFRDVVQLAGWPQDSHHVLEKYTDKLIK